MSGARISRVSGKQLWSRLLFTETALISGVWPVALPLNMLAPLDTNRRISETRARVAAQCRAVLELLSMGMSRSAPERCNMAGWLVKSVRV
jgi:hypothetical protein